MEVEAKARYMRIPPRKARLVANTVIGMPVKDALVVLQFTPRAAAKEVAKVVKSAAANASNNFSQDEDALIVKAIIVNEGPTIKRGRPRARGMYFSIFKRTSHITAIVDTEMPVVQPRRRRKPAAEEEAAPPKRAEKAETKAQKAKAGETKAEDAKPEDAEAAETEAADDQQANAETPEGEAPAEPAKTPEPEAAEVAEEARAAEAETEAAEVVPEADPDAAAGAEPKTEAEAPAEDKPAAEKPADGEPNDEKETS
ncbi:MAG: 50S ribosomal protein L22 [Candidatus Dormibacteraeota bacterium]|nr:50S ribosomal protein L22 [Candidatus Dormibacteraeota bacterium]